MSDVVDQIPPSQKSEASPPLKGLLLLLKEYKEVFATIGLQMAIRRRRITAIFRDDALAKLLAMPITVDSETDSYAWTTALRLSERFELTLYDAAYVELAQRRSLPLASLDQEMRAAASALNIELLGSAS
jgi:predicted nucleic acid-binding protein